MATIPSSEFLSFRVAHDLVAILEAHLEQKIEEFVNDSQDARSSIEISSQKPSPFNELLTYISDAASIAPNFFLRTLFSWYKSKFEEIPLLIYCCYSSFRKLSFSLGKTLIKKEKVTVCLFSLYFLKHLPIHRSLMLIYSYLS